MTRKKRRRLAADDVSVEMSSLIDCVFLLLIFFLVTTMMKKLEKQIPVEMPSGNASVASRAETDTRVIGLDRDGNYLFAEGNRQHDGNYSFKRLANLDRYLDKLAIHPKKNVRIYADASVPFQKVIDLLDKLQMKDCSNVDVRMIDYGSKRPNILGEEIDGDGKGKEKDSTKDGNKDGKLRGGNL